MRLPAVVFASIVVSTYLYVYNVITVGLLGRVHRIFSITRQLLLWKRKSSAKIENSTRTAFRRLQNSDRTGRSGDDDERWARSEIRRNFYSCLTRPEIFVGIIPRDDNIFNSRQDVTGSARAKF